MVESEWRGSRLLVLVPAILFLLSPGCAAEADILPSSPCSNFQRAGLFSGSNLKVQFFLFTPKNPNCGQLIEVNKTDCILNSTFNATLGTKILIHGFRVLGNKPSWIDGLTDVLLRVADVNVVVVDWVSGSTAQYYSAVENITELSIQISAFISRLLALGVPESSIHIIGVSLGAHVGGLVGHFFSGKLGRITGLDPAAYRFTRASAVERLDSGDAIFVEAIHTDADNFGIKIPVGHIDYFINGGKDQPGCPSLRQFYGYLICDHMRAVKLYISSLENPCPLIGFPCSSYKNFTAGDCLNCSNGDLQTCPRIGLLERGGIPMEELKSQIQVFLMTSTSAPFCVYHSLVEFHLQGPRSSSTGIEVKFIGENISTTFRIIIPKNEQLGRRIITHDVPLCQFQQVSLRFLVNNSLSRLWKNFKEDIVGTFCTEQLPTQAGGKMFCLSENLAMAENIPVTRVLAAQCE